jgi:putative DNA primase/helicase
MAEGIDRLTEANKKSTKQPNGEAAQEPWPDPHPLPDSLLPVAPFDFGLCPEDMRSWIADLCERMQCPPEFIAVSTMAGLGSIIGRKLAIRPKVNDDWNVIANQWAMLIGRPGILKSPAMGEACGRCTRFQPRPRSATRKR